jgi:hypothetical protein
VEFSAAVQGADFLLRWKTDNENDVRAFAIETSKDGQLFSLLGTITASGGSGQHSYKFTDKDANYSSSGVVYYRLKETDRDGAFTYSRIIAVSPARRYNFLISPNPGGDFINIKFDKSNNSQVRLVQLIDINGKEALRVIISSCSYTSHIQTGQLSSGLYLLIITENQKRYITKWIKQPAL